jgi:hypothetical protein
MSCPHRGAGFPGAPPDRLDVQIRDEIALEVAKKLIHLDAAAFRGYLPEGLCPRGVGPLVHSSEIFHLCVKIGRERACPRLGAEMFDSVHICNKWVRYDSTDSLPGRSKLILRPTRCHRPTASGFA